MAGRIRKFSLALSEQDKVILEKIVSSRTKRYERYNMILLVASRSSNNDIANNLWISRSVDNKIIKRFSSVEVQAALEDAAQPECPKELDVGQQTWIIPLRAVSLESFLTDLP